MISAWIMVLWFGGNSIERLYYFSTKDNCEMAYSQLKKDMDITVSHTCIKVESIKESL